jgi:hypothetical protein
MGEMTFCSRHRGCERHKKETPATKATGRTDYKDELNSSATPHTVAGFQASTSYVWHCRQLRPSP